MAALYPSPLLSAASSHLHSSTKMAFRPHPSPLFHGLELSFTGLVLCNEVHSLGQSFRTYGLRPNSWHTISCAINMTTGQSDDSGKMKFDQLIDKARQVWESSPQPVKSFPWKRADAEVPWYLILMAIFFTLLKLSGPYYPLWGRILIPHFANGGLLRTLIMVCLFVVQKTLKGIQNGTITTF